MLYLLYYCFLEEVREYLLEHAREYLPEHVREYLPEDARQKGYHLLGNRREEHGVCVCVCVNENWSVKSSRCGSTIPYLLEPLRS